MMTLALFIGANAQNLVTFRVDMNDYGVPANVTLNGNFNGWCGDCNPMADLDGDGVYEVEIDLPAGEIEYKFTIGPWTDEEMFAVGEACTKTTGQYTNRVRDVTTTETLDVVCWGSCDACTGVSINSSVTFKVDMSAYDGASYSEGVTLNGTFNGWCGDCTPMDDTDSDSIWETTLTIPTGDTIEFKYVLGAWVDDELFSGGESCTKTTTDTTGTFTNRYLVVTGDTTLPASCFAACEACGSVSVNELKNLSQFKLVPNPANNSTQLVLELNKAQKLEVELMNITGSTLQTWSYNTTSIYQDINLSNLSEGVYFINVRSQENVISKKLIVLH